MARHGRWTWSGVLVLTLLWTAGGPVQAQTTDGPITYAAFQELTASARAEITASPAAEIEQSTAESLAGSLQGMLSAVLPDPCFVPVYAAWWAITTDLGHIAAGQPVAALLDLDIATLTAADLATDCPASAPTEPPFGGLSVVACSPGDDDPNCQGGIHITNPVDFGDEAKLTVTIRNSSAQPSGPVTMLLLVPLLSESAFDWFMPDRLPMVHCNRHCRRRVEADATMEYATWAGLPAARDTDLTVTLRAAMRGVPREKLVVYNYFSMAVFAASTNDLLNCPKDDKGFGCIPRTWERTKVREWESVQLVTFRK